MGKDFGDLAHVLGDAKQCFMAFVKGVKDDEQARREGGVARVVPERSPGRSCKATCRGASSSE